ncbi:MAG: hypothetical protein GWN67_04660 [Phycisphaerae bacterium]|nr:hypothetical protein [Phycisphaerae bacterium]NIT57268.1 hypothetical protein [Fodinibius sp.]NIS51513.1 hypothetical protein [Phycisphaerae bacterium]NIU08156.1 hypothetical protein [Phycisphaerae bacterium]NIU55699.1 hypothetical protein [Phycisphaerae bacterium]
MTDDRASVLILLLTSVFVLGMGCGTASGTTFYVGISNNDEECKGVDLDKSLDVSYTDFAILANYWLESNCIGTGNCGGADIVRNNAVDIADLSLFTECWLSELSDTLNVHLAINNLWMYQNLPGAAGSYLVSNVAITDDPLSNSSYSYQWGFILPSDVNLEPNIISGGGSGDNFVSFAARSCSETEGLSEFGSVFKVRVTVIGNDHGNIGTVEKEFGIALLGDVNNDCRVDVADRSIINAFWQTGSAGKFTLRDCDLNCDGVVDVADRSIANAVWQGTLCRDKVTSPCPLR